ncbi:MULTISPECIES: flagellar export protein FliJ [Paenibacillus]|jgi:flagellar FliJ protein|uniref:Flagellar FliJ protein n=2 Tax=Paenibacillus TaxID=44249 RepID=A0A0M1QBN5_PAEPO|nr:MULTISPECIES: flagellar export protein FliJ [Paenibacillus]KAF6637602.1 flagellar export protein FliJ [Paenibacillus sp. EKM208P]MCF2718613.1 flagellar export protein FliJ [Paenibacillus sp. UKAQ_18]ADM69723.1 flagellar export protein FliJ [Paenibacillus polymyxa E681]AHC19585.1 flagellar export protein FliJ [Paenibacillus polymyxa CR1]ALA41856.1 flagellar export protein FliJ [Paenibacillus peoriae]
MRFQYSFQKVVDLKTNEKSQAEWLLSSAVGQLQAEEQTLTQLVGERNRVISAIQKAAEDCAPLSTIQELQAYVNHLDQCITRKHRDVQYAQQNVQSKQTVLTDKMLDEQVWLKAREKANVKFQQEMLLREQNELDEMASVRFAMKAR